LYGILRRKQLRNIGEKLANEYNSDSWVYENMELWNYNDAD